MDWGFNYNIEVLTRNEIKPIEIFVYPEGEFDPLIRFEKNLNYAFKNPNNVYIFSSEQLSVFKRFDFFEQTAKNSGKQAILEKTFTQRNGDPVYHIYKVVDGQSFL
jgi:hypothetical protein